MPKPIPEPIADIVNESMEELHLAVTATMGKTLTQTREAVSKEVISLLESLAQKKRVEAILQLAELSNLRLEEARTLVDRILIR